ncbi:MAG: hypothetical protein IJ553_05275 [Alloprevotella sp.]|nr:hypothetical protein [Alloprevotella sp.]
MEKDSFIFYRSFKEAIDLCPEEVRLKIYEAIAEYALTEQEPNITEPYAKLCWKLIKPQLEANWRRYKNGQAGGAPKGNRNAAKRPEENNQETTERQPTNNQAESEKQTNINDNENIKDNEKVKEKEQREVSATQSVTPTRARFTPPSITEVEAYCKERGNGVNAQQFCDHYTANGWKQKGGNPIKDWRAAVRTWERNGINQPQQVTHQPQQRKTLEERFREYEAQQYTGTRHNTI